MGACVRLKQKNHDLVKDLRETKKRLTEKEALSDHLQKENTELTITISQLKSEIKNLQDQMKKLSTHSSNQLAPKISKSSNNTAQKLRRRSALKPVSEFTEVSQQTKLLLNYNKELKKSRKVSFAQEMILEERTLEQKALDLSNLSINQEEEEVKIIEEEEEEEEREIHQIVEEEETPKSQNSKNGSLTCLMLNEKTNPLNSNMLGEIELESSTDDKYADEEGEEEGETEEEQMIMLTAHTDSSHLLTDDEDEDENTDMMITLNQARKSIMPISKVNFSKASATSTQKPSDRYSINTTNFIPNTPEKESKTTLEETSDTVSSDLLLNSVTRRKKRSKKDDVPSRKDFLNFENDPSTPTKSRETEEEKVVSIATEKSAAEMSGRRPRRTRGAAVNYAEPSLNKKMRNENAFKTSKKKATKDKKTKENLKSKPQILKPKNEYTSNIPSLNDTWDPQKLMWVPQNSQNTQKECNENNKENSNEVDFSENSNSLPSNHESDPTWTMVSQGQMRANKKSRSQKDTSSKSSKNYKDFHLKEENTV